MKFKFINKKNIIYILCLLLFFEITIRIFENFFLETNVSTLYSYINMYKDYYTIKPNTLITQPERYGDITYEINSYGFRNQFKVNGNYKFLFLGDSITFGLGVQGYDIFSTLISNELNNKSRKVSCINLSMFGYTPWNELNVLKEIGLKFKPDQIILQLYMNDFYNSSNNIKKTDSTNNLRTAVNTLVALKNMVINQSALFRRLRQIVQRTNYICFHNFRRKYFINTLNDREPQSINNLFMQFKIEDIISFQHIKEISDIAKKYNIPFKIILTPNEIQLFTDKFDHINDKIFKFCQNNNIQFFDMLKPFRLSNNKEHIFNDGLHLSPLGHQILCDYFIEHIAF